MTNPSHTSTPTGPVENLFDAPLFRVDPQVTSALQAEYVRQSDGAEFIASENIVSAATLQAIGNVLTNKYAEGYPKRRYYGGCVPSDTVEQLAIERAKTLFDVKFANVQAHSGASANLTAFFALLKPGDCFLSLALDAGGHLSHGAPPNVSGQWFQPVHYGVNSEGLIDYDATEQIARQHQPKLIIAGGSAYAGLIDFARFRAIADAVGAYLLVDMAHFAGLVAGRAIPSPTPHAHLCTSTTNKTLRGPRGGLIISNDESIGKRINASIFPGLQGGPQMNIIAAKAVAFGEALQPEFAHYARHVIDNAQALAHTLREHDLDLVHSTTQTHLLLVDLRRQKLTGKAIQQALEHAGITCNKNGVPNDPEKPMVTSGIRLGTPAVTTRGMGVGEMRWFAERIAQVIHALEAAHGDIDSIRGKLHETQEQVQTLCRRFPIYPEHTMPHAQEAKK